MNLLNEIFGIYNAYCLILDKRIDNWKDIHSQFLTKGLNVQRFLVGNGSLQEEYCHVDTPELPPAFSESINYETWWKTPNPYNAWISHRKIIGKSLAEGFDHVLILEDDVFIEDDFDEVLSKTKQFFKDHKWDAVYFGGYHNPNSWKFTTNDNVIKLAGSGGWHAVCLTRPIMEKLMTLPPIGPYDWTMGKYLHQQYDCFAIYPSIISQQSGFSWVEMGNLEKPSRYKR
jgi:GR25 family glycosyltransferase involved in LPS biosynthesis